jgi:hypothetical protein
MRDDLKEDLPIGILESGTDTKGNPVDLPANMVGFNINGKKIVMNKPSDNEKQSPEYIFTKNFVDLESRANRGDPNAVEMLKHMKNFKDHKTKSSGGRSLKMTMPDGTVVEQVVGDLSGAQKGRLEKNYFDVERAISGLDALTPMIEPDQLGIGGAIKENIIDNLLVDYIPEEFGDFKERARQRITTREGIKLWTESVLRSISGDPRFSNVDRAAISAIAGKPGATVSYEKTIIAQRGIRKMFQERLRQSANELGRPVPTFAMSPEMINDAVSDNSITTTDAEDLLRKIDPEFVNYFGKTMKQVIGETNIPEERDQKIFIQKLKEYYGVGNYNKYKASQQALLKNNANK